MWAILWLLLKLCCVRFQGRRQYRRMTRASNLVLIPPFLLKNGRGKGGLVWYLWADFSALAIPNNSGQSDHHLVMCLPINTCESWDESQGVNIHFFDYGYLLTGIKLCSRGDIQRMSHWLSILMFQSPMTNGIPA